MNIIIILPVLHFFQFFPKFKKGTRRLMIMLKKSPKRNRTFRNTKNISNEPDGNQGEYPDSHVDAIDNQFDKIHYSKKRF